MNEPCYVAVVAYHATGQATFGTVTAEISTLAT